MTLLIVGLSPSTKFTPRLSDNPSLKRLNKWLDILGHKYYSFTNIIPESEVYLDPIIDYNTIIALGGKVSDILTKNGIRHFKMPHPSPLNRLLNDKDYEMKCLNECKEWLKKF